MSRLLKSRIVEELASEFDLLEELIVVGFSGMSVEQTEVLRNMLAERDLEMTVVKNSLAGRALDQVGMKGVKDLLDGPSAFLYGRDEGAVTASRVLEGFTRKTKRRAIQVRGAYLDGKVLGAREAAALARLPTREEMIGAVACQARSPGARIAGTVVGPASRIASCIESLVDKLEGEEGAGE